MEQGFYNQDFPFGSARFASRAEIHRAGMFDQHADSVLVGFLGDQPLWYAGMGGLLLIAGARSGKLRDVLSYNICHGIYAHSMQILDMKGELAAISRDQTPDRKFCIYWNPHRLHGLPADRINPAAHIKADSLTLVSDTKVFCENKIPASGSSQAVFFERRAQEILEALVLTLVKRDGVLILPALYHTVNLLVTGGDAWLDFAFEMSESAFALVRRVEEEIAAARDDSSGGFKGILGELTKSLACLSDPVLMDAVSPPYDFSLSQMCADDRAYQLYLMCPPEFTGAWAPVLKDFFVCGMAYKSRSPSAPRQTWILDECAQLGAFPLVTKLYTYGAGIGIRPWAVFQSAKQTKALGPDAETILLSSAALQSWFGVRDFETASMLSQRIGTETLSYIDPHRRAAALREQQKAALQVFDGRSPFKSGLELAYQSRMARLPVRSQRPLRRPDEILGMPETKQVIFADGLAHGIWAERRPYYAQAFMASRYHPNPYHPPEGRVRIKTRFGHRWLRVVTEPVPRRFAHYPQYADGLWTRLR